MDGRRLVGSVGLLAIVCFGLVACELATENRRQLTIAVSNETFRPAVLIVADATGREVGTTEPSVVPRRAKELPVTFTVPNTSDWRIIVNPGDDVGGPVVFASEVPSASARCRY